jgi:hypothetical protein
LGFKNIYDKLLASESLYKPEDVLPYAVLGSVMLGLWIGLFSELLLLGTVEESGEFEPLLLTISKTRTGIIRFGLDLTKVLAFFLTLASFILFFEFTSLGRIYNTGLIRFQLVR